MNDRSGYVIMADPNKCKACRKCELACIASHNHLTMKEAAAARKNGEFSARVHVIKTDSVKMPVQCHQCDPAPCAQVCPTKALVQIDGRVRMRVQYCAACSLCIMACPFGAITLSFIGKPEEDDEGNVVRRRVAIRCDLCEEWRVREGKRASACVEVCPSGALRMVTLEEYHRLREDGMVTDHPGVKPEAEEDAKNEASSSEQNQDSPRA